jgi:hypothetical protein
MGFTITTGHEELHEDEYGHLFLIVEDTADLSHLRERLISKPPRSLSIDFANDSKNFSGANALLAAVFASTTKEVSVVGFHDDGADDLYSVLATTRKRISFSKFRVDMTKFAAAIALNKSVTGLELHAHRGSLGPLYEMLRTNATIKSLMLNGNTIDMHALSAVLETNTTLKELTLNRCDIVNARMLGNALIANKTLKTLQLHFNRISDIDPLAVALRLNNTLEALGLGFNAIENEGLTELSDALKRNTSLKTLDLGYNRISDVSELRAGLEANCTLKNLTIGGNSFDVTTLTPNSWWRNYLLTHDWQSVYHHRQLRIDLCN